MDCKAGANSTSSSVSLASAISGVRVDMARAPEKRNSPENEKVFFLRMRVFVAESNETRKGN
jgi:hypothetical protein